MTLWIHTAVTTFIIFICLRKAIERRRLAEFILYLSLLFAWQLYNYRQYEIWETLWKASMMAALGALFSYAYYLMIKFGQKKNSH